MPILIQENNISTAWVKAKEHILSSTGYQDNNLLVVINNPLLIDSEIHRCYTEFCLLAELTVPDKLSSTIFPKKVYNILGRDLNKLYEKYPRLHKVLKGRWGSYFNQMINWSNGNEVINQLEKIINKINERDHVYKAAYTIQITNPIKHLGWTRGGPCLNNILIQLENNPKKMSMLAVYRSHDFAVKAYGNYIGLGHLLEFFSSQTDFQMGTLSCISSHAFIEQEHVSNLMSIGLQGD